MSEPLPSRFQLGDQVRARGRNGVVTGIMFRAGKVYYEVAGVVHDSAEVTEPMRLVATASPYDVSGNPTKEYPGE